MFILRMKFYGISLAASLVAISSAYDPVSDFCSRWDHQSVVKNNRLYIDGGNVLFRSPSSPGKPYVLGNNNLLIEVDLSNSWDWKTNISEIGLVKTPNPNTGTSPPSLIRGAMYRGGQDDPNIYTFGGTTSQLNSSFSSTYPEPSTYSLWSFDTTAQSWDQYDVTSSVPIRPSRGAYTEAADQGLAFYFNGEIDQGSAAQTTGLENQTLGLGGLVVLNLTSSGVSARNLSTIRSDTAAISSELVYVPEVGNKGILVQIGGALISTAQEAVQNGTLNAFDLVNVFDIASSYGNGPGAWYTQTTSGSVPPPRIDSCVVVATAPDNSSHNIYLYGGQDPVQNKMYDDIYILSLPSFTWTKMYSGESPRFGHTCHLVGNRQMLTIGGSTDLNLTRTCDWETKSVAIMDLSTKTWGSVYNAFAAPYLVTSDVVTVIGGTSSGGATMKEPQGGFVDPALEQLFTTPARSTATGGSAPSSSAAPSSSSKHISTAAIAGGLVAALLVVAIIIGTTFLLLRRRRQCLTTPVIDVAELTPAYEKDHDTYSEMAGKRNHAELASQPEAHELPGETPTYELGVNSRTNSRLQGNFLSDPR